MKGLLAAGLVVLLTASMASAWTGVSSWTVQHDDLTILGWAGLLAPGVVILDPIITTRVENQGGGYRACGSLPTGVETVIAADNAVLSDGKPWNYAVQGHAAIANPSGQHSASFQLHVVSNGGWNTHENYALPAGAALPFSFGLLDASLPANPPNHFADAFAVSIIPTDPLTCEDVFYITTEHD